MDNEYKNDIKSKNGTNEIWHHFFNVWFKDGFKKIVALLGENLLIN